MADEGDKKKYIHVYLKSISAYLELILRGERGGQVLIAFITKVHLIGHFLICLFRLKILLFFENATLLRNPVQKLEFRVLVVVDITEVFLLFVIPP